MSIILYCGYFWLFLSVWAVVQLAIMGQLFKMEMLNFIEAVTPEDYADFDDFIAKTSANYLQVAYNCWIAAGMYVVVVFVSCACICVGKGISKKKAEAARDEELACGPLIDPSIN